MPGWNFRAETERFFMQGKASIKKVGPQKEVGYQYCFTCSNIYEDLF